MAEIKKKEIVIFSSGTWDLAHIGHLNIFKKSKRLGDKLIIAVSTDELVESYKEMKPIIPYKQRFEMVRSCRYVDLVIPQTTLTDVRDLNKYKVDIITIGSDWKNKYLKGLEWAKKNGIKIVYLPYTKSVSTTKITKKIINNAYKIIFAHSSRGISKIY